MMITLLLISIVHFLFFQSGALGKRTRFQSKDIAQVLLEVKRTQPDETEAQFLELDVPAVKLNASLLPKVWYFGSGFLFEESCCFHALFPYL